MPPFIYYSKRLRFLFMYTLDPEIEKEHMASDPYRESSNGRKLEVSESTHQRLMERYWYWEFKAYTSPEQRESVHAWEDFRRCMRDQGIKLHSVDRALDKPEHRHLRHDFERFFGCCFLIAHDRAPSFYIHYCHQLIVEKGLEVLRSVLYCTRPERLEDVARNIAQSHDTMDQRLLEFLAQQDRDTVGKASAIIQMMLYIQKDPGLWLNYLFGLDQPEVAWTMQRVVDALLDDIFGEDGFPGKSECT